MVTRKELLELIEDQLFNLDLDLNKILNTIMKNQVEFREDLVEDGHLNVIPVGLNIDLTKEEVLNGEYKEVLMIKLFNLITDAVKDNSFIKFSGIKNYVEILDDENVYLKSRVYVGLTDSTEEE